jgi:hypothetical protein
MKRLITTCFAATMILAIGSVANANWQQGYTYKMHYPQLPYPYGWDVALDTSLPYTLLDNWQRTESGPVKDIHFRVSFRDGFEPPKDFVGHTFTARIPSDTLEESDIMGSVLWQRTFTGDQYVGEYAGSDVQGWFNPLTQEAIYPDHSNYYLANIDSIENPFVQDIYWLAIQAMQPEGANYEVGWKTSDSPHFMNDASRASMAGAGDLTYPFNDPCGRSGQSIDLAFVITPEPATICLCSASADYYSVEIGNLTRNNHSLLVWSSLHIYDRSQ